MIKALSKYIYHFLIGIMLLFLVYFIWKIGFGIPSSFTDLSFHLATAQGFSRAGGIVTWDFWESLPLGRPHNYPPLFHLVLASILKIGFSPTVAIKIMMELTIVGGLAIYSWGLTKLFNIRVAFWAIALLFFSSHFIELSATVMPATIVTFLVPALLYFVINKKWLSYFALLVIMLYLHLFMPYFILLSMLIYLIFFEKKLLKPFLIASVISFVFYLPWLIHIILGGWEYIKYFDVNTGPDIWNKYVLINFTVIFLAIFGTLVLICKRKLLPERYFFFLILAIIILSPSFIIASRLLDSHFLVFAVILATIIILEIWQSRFKIVLLILFVIYSWFTPTLIVGKYTKIDLRPSIINYNNILYHHIYNNPNQNYSPIINGINKKAEKGDTVTTITTNFDSDPVDKNYRLSISNIFASYTNLATLDLRQPEIYHRPLPDITKSKFLLTSSPLDKLDSTFFSNLGYTNNEDIANFVKNNFQLISDVSPDFNSTLYCLYNKADTHHEQIPIFKFPLWLGDSILLVLIGIILYDNRKVKNVKIY